MCIRDRVHNNPQNQCFNEDANNLVKRIEADLVYIDPPYNSRQYCDTCLLYTSRAFILISSEPESSVLPMIGDGISAGIIQRTEKE